ncbi:MAG: GDSL-type esterase/lipase family protein [Arhodomonas sp.]|nr:GDSL-type esterase/lipase family protein [Arhodomonas sp.]
MLRILLAAVLLCLAQGAAAAPVTILVLGDSLSAAYGMDRRDGWAGTAPGTPAAQGQRCPGGQRQRQRRHHPGRAGSRLPGGPGAHTDPDVVVIELGGNDGLRGLPLGGDAPPSLAAMVEAALRSHGARVLLRRRSACPPATARAFIERLPAGSPARSPPKVRDVPAGAKVPRGGGRRSARSCRTDGDTPQRRRPAAAAGQPLAEVEPLLPTGKASRAAPRDGAAPAPPRSHREASRRVDKPKRIDQPPASRVG